MVFLIPPNVRTMEYELVRKFAIKCLLEMVLNVVVMKQ